MSKCAKALIAVLLVIALSLFLLPGTAVAQDEEPRIALVITYTDYNSEVAPGEQNVLYLQVINRGNVPVTDIRIYVEPPKGWDVEISPAVIDYLGVDGEKTIDMLVTPDKYADRGSHRIRLIAEADETKDTLTVYVKVDTATTIWTWIGAGIACIAVASFIFIFIRSGRKQTQLPI
jgi:uncharacterized membrane protein